MKRLLQGLAITVLALIAWEYLDTRIAITRARRRYHQHHNPS